MAAVIIIIIVNQENAWNSTLCNNVASHMVSLRDQQYKLLPHDLGE